MSLETVSAPATDVLFYVLATQDAASRQAFIAKLVNKIWQQRRHCDICCQHQAELSALDEAIWQFKSEAFIPHAIALSYPAPIQLWSESVVTPCQDVLLNGHPDFPQNFQNYQRAIEVLDQSPELIQRGRERWKKYQSLGFDPVLHKIK